MQFLVKTLAGLEPALEKELYKSGASNLHAVTRGFICEADMRWMYHANYTLRTALRILLPVAEFEARNERELYDGIFEVAWSDYMHVSQTFAVDAVVRSRFFRHSQYPALKTKDAVVDQFRERTGRRPNVNVEAPQLLIHVHIQDEHVTALLDTSGGSLHRRGYRRDQVEAPLNEVLAAGMIQLAGWTGETTFFDPMCGSGTLPIEAAMRAMHMPAQYNRLTPLGFMKWMDFDKKLWAEVKTAADAQMLSKPTCDVVASDRDPRARNITATNMMAARVEPHIRLQKAIFEQVTVPESAGVLMFNPPYNERMVDADLIRTYSTIGNTLKQRFTGWEAWIISSNREALKRVGLRPGKKHTVFNGALECGFWKFELF